MCKRLELDDYVFNRLNMTEKKDGTVLHQTKPIHNLAVILAYKQLEAEGKIKIERPSDVPFPMTDNNTLFSTVNLDYAKGGCMGIKYVYEVKIPAICINVEAKDAKEALKKARGILKGVVADRLLNTDNWKTKPIAVYDGALTLPNGTTVNKANP